MRSIILIFLMINCLFISCNKSRNIDDQSIVENHISTEYTELFKIMKNGFIDRDKVDWENLEKKVIEKSKISKYSAIEEAITLLGNNHTHYLTKENILISGRFPRQKIDSTCLLSVNENSKLTQIPNVAYIRVKRHGYNKKISDQDYIFQTLKIISNEANSKFWIIDLRDNSGGSNWVMMNSLLPFYSDGLLGYTSTKNAKIPWSLKDGYIYNGDVNLSENYIGKPIRFKINPKQLYVLVNHVTSSASEAVLISLKSLPNVKILGSKTNGAATMNADIDLSNGDKIVLTAGYMMDVRKKIYKEGINPDVKLCDENKILNFILNDISQF